NSARDHHGNAGEPHLGAAGAADRQRSGGFDGKEEAGGVLLMSTGQTSAALVPTADTDIGLWLEQQTSKSLLRFLTCGSVDDGKSTLIGRLLYDSQLILDDQLSSL